MFMYNIWWIQLNDEDKGCFFIPVMLCFLLCKSIGYNNAFNLVNYIKWYDLSFYCTWLSLYRFQYCVCIGY